MRAPGGVPQLVAGDQAVVLPPQQYVAELAEVPAVADDAVLGRVGAGEEGGLGGAGDGGQDGAERGAETGLAEGLEVGHVVEETGGEADDVQDEGEVGSAGCLLVVGSRQLLEAEVCQQVPGEGEFGGDAVGELGAGSGAQLRREGLPGVGLDLQVVGEGVWAADEAGRCGPQDGGVWR